MGTDGPPGEHELDCSAVGPLAAWPSFCPVDPRPRHTPDRCSDIGRLASSSTECRPPLVGLCKQLHVAAGCSGVCTALGRSSTRGYTLHTRMVSNKILLCLLFHS